MRAVAIQFVRHARCPTYLGGRAYVDTQRTQIDERERVPVCVWRGCIKGEHIVATVHGDDITIGGERSAVELLIRKISRKFEIKKQVIGEDPDFDTSGRILNRVVEWGRDGITQSRRTRGTSEKYCKSLSWNEQITLRLHAPWEGRMRAAKEGMKARERTMRTGTDPDQARVGRRE